MAKPKKLILVTATHHPLHELWVKLVEDVAQTLNLEKEIRYEDYVLLTEYGDTDDLGMTWLPQLLIELEDGTIKLLLSKMPLNKALQPDYEKAKEEVLSKIKEFEEGGGQ
ncbi:hypothetical protein J4526_02080 [Desulfurococcaceae archaeon MEX13E-LK6-19]|nr:hypothetical protein J4526_02080 [Desulfurococcaceae archaeon MEX13E-LK6-19]